MKVEILLKEKNKERDNVLQMWSNDLNALAREKDFDRLSKKSERKIKKLAKKYASMLNEIEEEIEELEKQIK